MKKLIVYIDGGARGNPGPGAVGVVICNEKKEVLKEYKRFLGTRFTNNQAEYQAFIFALQKLKQIFGKKLVQKTPVEVRTDSELLFRQLNREYKIQDPDLQSLFLQAWNLWVEFPLLKLRLVKRENNKRADELVNQALDQKVQE